MGKYKSISPNNYLSLYYSLSDWKSSKSNLTSPFHLLLIYVSVLLILQNVPWKYTSYSLYYHPISVSSHFQSFLYSKFLYTFQDMVSKPHLCLCSFAAHIPLCYTWLSPEQNKSKQNFHILLIPTFHISYLLILSVSHKSSQPL